MIRIGLLLVLVPLSLILAYAVHAPPAWIFAVSVVAIAPLADLIRRATEEIAVPSGPAIGGLLNVTFGNATELILALFVLKAGHQDVVKAQITGAIIGNGLLGLGMAILVGSLRKPSQEFDRDHAGLLSTLLLLVLISLLTPALFDYAQRTSASAHSHRHDEHLSLAVAVVLILIYIANLIYILVTHRTVYPTDGKHKDARWSVWLALAVLAGATVVTAVESELISNALESTASGLGLSPLFLGIVVLAVIGNAAEYLSACYFAWRSQMDIAVGITVGSSIQIGLLVAPVLVLVSYTMGHPMSLVFNNPLELIAIAAVAFTVKAITQDGKSTWFEGVLLLGVYILLAMAFFFSPVD